MDSRYEIGVNYKGTVKNGVVVSPLEAKLPDGAEMEVISLETRANDPPFLQAILKLAKPRDWPEDFALNHEHSDAVLFPGTEESAWPPDGLAFVRK